MCMDPRCFTEASSQHLNSVSFKREHRNTQTYRDTKPIIHRSYQGHSRQTLKVSVIVGLICINGSYLFKKIFNVYSCKAHDIDSGGTHPAGRKEHDDIPLPHMVAKGKVRFISASVNTTKTKLSHQ